MLPKTPKDELLLFIIANFVKEKTTVTNVV